jgi:catechol 2,3-dioxygenase-like lactoylglutathione lyase family enzyme
MMMRSMPLLAALALASAAPAAESPIGRSGIQQVALTVSNLDRAVAFYRDRLGLRLMFVTNGMAFFDTGGTRLMISLDRKRARQRRLPRSSTSMSPTFPPPWRDWQRPRPN